MSTLTQFLGGLKPAKVINAGTTSVPTVSPLDPGALTANVWKEVLNINTPGILHGAWVWHGDSTSRTVGIRITIDGVVAVQYDEPSATANTTIGAFAGCFLSAAAGVLNGFSVFQKSLRVEVRASDTNTAVRHQIIYAGS
jgi:hypothetical protein